MKTNKIKYFATGVILMLILGACSDDLERFPHASIERSQAFETIEDAATWNTGMYSLLQNRVYGIFMYSTDIQADQLNASLDYGNRNGALHRWEDLESDNYTLRDTWSLLYNGIANANVAIEGMQTIETESAEDQERLERYIAEAHLVRAFYYHKLMLLFAPDYDPATADSDLGVPLMLEYDVSALPSRSTVEEVYQQILQDIEVAKEGLSDVPGQGGAIYFNSDVVTAFEARVNFHMENWSAAYAAATELIQSGRYPLISDVDTFRRMWHEDYAQEDILQLYTEAPNELANANSVYLGFNAGTGRFTPDFIPSEWVVEMFPENDIRRAVYFEEKPVTISGIQTELTLVNKYPGNPALFTTSSTNYQHAPKVFRIAEMYLIAAESASHIEGVDALEPLNALRTARNLDPLSALSGDALMQAIKDERFRELAFEGYRLEDLQRWDQGFERRDPQNTNVIVLGPQYHTLTIAPTNPKFTWGIPSNDITVNPNLSGQQNPGW